MPTTKTTTKTKTPAVRAKTTKPTTKTASKSASHTTSKNSNSMSMSAVMRGNGSVGTGNLSEQDLLNDILVQQKQLSATYTTFITEADCPNLRKVLTNNLTQVLQDQYATFDAMRQKGYYQSKTAQAADVKKTITQFSAIQPEMK